MTIKKSKVTFVVPRSLKVELSEQVIRDGYGMRGKSKWVVEAINYLLELDNFTELVHINSTMSGFEVTETVVVDLTVKRKLDEAILTVRKDFPALEGVQSGIVRTALIQRLLRKNISSYWKLVQHVE